MKDSDLGGGSAAPATPDVPTKDRILSVRMTEELHERLKATAAARGWTVAMFVTNLLVSVTANPNGTVSWSAPLNQLTAPAIHSGVAGEPEATTKESCCPEFARNGYSHTEICPAFDTAAADPAVAVAERRAIESHTPTPDPSAAASTAGGTLVSVEAAARTVGAASTAYDRWRVRPNRHAYVFDAIREAAGGAVVAAAPLIAAQALRSAAALVIDDDGDRDNPTYVWHDDMCDYGPPPCDCSKGERYRWLIARADELERGGDHG